MKMPLSGCLPGFGRSRRDKLVCSALLLIDALTSPPALAQVTSRVGFAPGANVDARTGVYYNAIYDLSNFYPEPVRHDQRFNAVSRENYLDWSVGDFDFRFGSQQII